MLVIFVIYCWKGPMQESLGVCSGDTEKISSVLKHATDLKEILYI